MTIFKPTYLYIKQHRITGKLYFGKTTKNPEKYCGSGKRWCNHIDYHGREHVETLWYSLFYDREACIEFALLCSEQWGIVESKEWMNLINETGLDSFQGEHGYKPSDETKQKMSKAKLGTKQSSEHRANIAKSKLGNSSRRKSWRMKLPSNEIVEVGNLTEFCKEKKLPYNTIYGSFFNGKEISSGCATGYQLLS